MPIILPDVPKLWVPPKPAIVRHISEEDRASLIPLAAALLGKKAAAPFPTIAASLSTTGPTFNNTSTTLLPVHAFPSGILAGDLLVYIWSSYPNATPSPNLATLTDGSGTWVILDARNPASGYITAIAYKIATGSETSTTNLGGTLTANTASFNTNSWGYMLVFRGTSNAVPAHAGTSYTSGSLISLPLVAPSWGTSNTFWIGVWAAPETSTATVSSYPSGLPDNRNTFVGNGQKIGFATASKHASSMSPGSFALSSSISHSVGYTIAIKP